MLPPPPRSTLFPYTTLFRSQDLYMTKKAAPAVRRVAIIGGNRIPFAKSNTVYSYASNQDMLTAALNGRSEEHTSELQSRPHLVCRLLLEKKKKIKIHKYITE